MKFADLKLPVGTRLQLLAQGQDYKLHSCEAILLGFRQGASIILQLNKKPPQILLRVGLKFNARLAIAAGIVDFSSEVSAIAETPYAYIHADYPQAIELKALRHHLRYKYREPVSVVAHTSMGIATSAIAGQFLDISLAGARVALESDLSDLVTHLQISAHVSIAGLSQPLSIQADVKRRFDEGEKENEYPFVYGISFRNIKQDEQLLLMALCYELSR